MKNQKIFCTKCKSFEVEFVEQSADPMNLQPTRLVCKKCGNKFDFDSGISVMNQKTMNTFPNPNNDLNIDDPFTKRIKSKREVN